MSYLKEVEYKILPNDSYTVIRNCPKCGIKTNYINTNNFRVNANGNQIDIWLIYQCEKCKHTYNLTIYERIKPSAMSVDQYNKFLANDKELALAYGNTKALFARNKAEIDLEHINYDVVGIDKKRPKVDYGIVISNPYEIKIRADKVLSQILGITRNQIKQLIKQEVICCDKNYVGKATRILVKEAINNL